MSPSRGRGPAQQPSPALNWYPIDLHIHTPATEDYEERDKGYIDILRKARDAKLSMIAFTDHNTVAGYAGMLREIESLQMLERLGRLLPEERQKLEEYQQLLKEVVVLPGFEFTATFGFHVLGIFPPSMSPREVEHLLLDLNVPAERLDGGSTEVGASADVITAYHTIAEAGGIVIAAHANSTHGVAMRGLGFGGQTKIAYTQDSNLHALEVTDLDVVGRRSTASFFNGSKPEYPRRMHCIQGSDAHRINGDPNDKAKRPGVGERATDVLLPAPTFEALKALFLSSDFTRTRPHRPIETPQYDPIQEARKLGPNIVQAFHPSLPTKGIRRRRILEDMVAFANTNGGAVYIGVGATPTSPVNGVTRPQEAAKLLKVEVEHRVGPQLDVTMDIKTTAGKQLIVINVPAGAQPPYAFDTGEIYVRQESETSLALRDEIVRLVLRGLPRETTPAKELAEPAVAVNDAGEPLVSTPPPTTGVEVLESEERGGTIYHTVKDLRNSNVVHNVTRHSARRLWRYAILEHEEHPLDEAQVTWHGNIGLWKSYTRGGVKRYNLVERGRDGKLHIYFGVTEEGIHDEWTTFLNGDGNLPVAEDTDEND